jgi:1,4-dihydroxy-2-naphthoate octaprenyltransferase
MSRRLLVRAAVSVAAGVAALVALIAIRPAAWIVLLLGSMALAGLYIYARMNSRYDPLDPRFGSCIPPLPRKDQ